MNKYIGIILKTEYGYVLIIGKQYDDELDSYFKEVKRYPAYQTLELVQKMLEQEPNVDDKYMHPVESASKSGGRLYITDIIDAQENALSIPTAEDGGKEGPRYLHTIRTTPLGQQNGLEKYEQVITTGDFNIIYDGGSLSINYRENDHLRICAYGPGMWVHLDSVIE